MITGCDIQGNGAYGVQATHHSTVTVQGSIVGPNTSSAVSAAYGSTIWANGITAGGSAAQSTLTASAASLIVSSGTHTGTPVFDPAIGASGNSGSWSV